MNNFGLNYVSIWFKGCSGWENCVGIQNVNDDMGKWEKLREGWNGQH